MTKNHGSAQWTGPIKDGKGAVSTGRGALDKAPYGFRSRFEDGPGTNPEELIAAAHASCFAMALSKEMGEHGMNEPSIDAKAEVTLEEKDGGFAVTRSHLMVRVSAKGGDEEKAREAVKSAFENCPISKLLDCEISHEADYDF